MKGPWPAILGFVAAAIFPSAAMSVLSVVTADHYDLPRMLAGVAIFLPFAVAAVAVFGIPAFLLMRRFAPGEWWMAAGVGWILSPLLLLVLPDQLVATNGPFFIVMTVLTALVFWWVWRWAEDRVGIWCCAR
jgi:hypothetical protein